jgi:hypothetical protein
MSKLRSALAGPASTTLFRAWLPWMLVVGAGLSARAAEDDPSRPPKVWQGTWSNRKYKTSGPLKCTATRQDDRTAAARFEGTFMGDSFGYNVEVTTRPERDRTVVEGTATLDGDQYEWSGFVRGKVFYGQYRSLKGNNGEFRLEETQ